jgi:hypothetical protein
VNSSAAWIPLIKNANINHTEPSSRFGGDVMSLRVVAFAFP